ncbi:MAG: FAD-binding oxidoreductase [Pseudomonadota bacterium]
MTSVDVTIRGAGILGLSIAWACAARGATIRIIDPSGPGAGSSGGLVGALAPHVPENWNVKKAFQLESLLAAEAFWKEVDAASGLSSGYIRSGRIQPILDAHGLELASQRAASAQSLWPEDAAWSVKSDEENVWQITSPSGKIIYDTLSALLHPRQAIASLVAALASRGVEVTADSSEHGAVVWATGVAGLEALNLNHPRQVGTGVKGQAALLAFNARGAPQLFVDGLHVIPHQDGTVAIGSTSERNFEAATNTDAALEDLIDTARNKVPVLRNAPVIDRWAGVRPRTRSRAPMLGAWPDRPCHFIANGGFKIGFGMAPKIADVMAALILDGKDLIPESFQVAASF